LEPFPNVGKVRGGSFSGCLRTGGMNCAQRKNGEKVIGNKGNVGGWGNLKVFINESKRAIDRADNLEKSPKRNFPRKKDIEIKSRNGSRPQVR